MQRNAKILIELKKVNYY